MSPPLFAKPPHSVSADGALSQFNVSISDDQIQNLKTLLKLVPIAAPNYENSQDDRRFGSPRQWLVDSVDYWQNKFDWRKQEAEINTVSHFKYDVRDDDGHTYTIHFAALFSEKKDAVPLLMPHGWPGSFIEYLPILLAQREKYASAPDTLPYHLIAPSLIGYGFSSPPPINKDFVPADNSRLLHKMMLGLGFGQSGYIIQGGDVGSFLAEASFSTYDEVKAIHLNLYLGDGKSDPSRTKEPLDEQAAESAEKFRTVGMAYASCYKAEYRRFLRRELPHIPSCLDWREDDRLVRSGNKAIPGHDPDKCLHILVYWNLSDLAVALSINFFAIQAQLSHDQWQAQSSLVVSA